MLRPLYSQSHEDSPSGPSFSSNEEWMFCYSLSYDRLNFTGSKHNYYPQTNEVTRRSCYYTCLSVILFTAGVSKHATSRGCTPSRQTPLHPDQTSPLADTYSRTDTHPPLGRHPMPLGEIPWAHTPLGKHFLGQTLPWADNRP